MSLDKYVSRGFTSSVGNSSGQWVGRSPESSQQQSFQPNNDGGTSFVLGGGGLSNPSYRGKQTDNSQPRREHVYSFDAADVRSNGTTGRGEIPQGCFGSRRSGGGATGGADSQKILMFIFLVVVIIACAFIAVVGGSGSKARVKRPPTRGGNYGATEQPLQRGHPVWY